VCAKYHILLMICIIKRIIYNNIVYTVYIMIIYMTCPPIYMSRKYAAFNKRPRPKDLCASSPSWKVTNSKRSDDWYIYKVGRHILRCPPRPLDTKKILLKKGRMRGKKMYTRTHIYLYDVHYRLRRVTTTTCRARISNGISGRFLIHVIIMHAAIKYILLLYIYTVVTFQHCVMYIVLGIIIVITRYYRKRV